MRQFSFKTRARGGETLLGTWIQILSPESVEMAAAAGHLTRFRRACSGS